MRSDGKSWTLVMGPHDGTGTAVRVMRFFFLGEGDTPIDSSRRGRKSTLVGDDMAEVVSAAA